MTTIKAILKGTAVLLLALTFAGITSCSESQSYSELLNEEEKAVNWYLAGQKIELDVPEKAEDFQMGPDAPFYKLDEDGYVYMQVIDPGNPDERVEEGDVVYFRFERVNLKYMYLGMEYVKEGNSDLTLGDYKFLYKNQYLESSYKNGTGIQMPMKYFGYGSEVNLVLRSYYGFQEDQTNCFPYLINIRYFKPEY